MFSEARGRRVPNPVARGRTATYRRWGDRDTRTAARRYAVRVEREYACTVAAEPAPGYDDHLPHDLVHFVVESHFGLADGIFGRLAAGGEDRLFRPVDTAWTRRDSRRTARRSAPAGTGKPAATAPSDTARSEHRAATAYNAWLFRHGRIKAFPDAEAALARAGVGPGDLDAVLDRLDPLAVRWHALAVGGSLSLDWPLPERVRRRA